MTSWLTPSRMAQTVSADGRPIYEASYRQIAEKTDLMFAWLFGFQWALGVGFALWQAPLAWDGAQSSVHFHVYLAVLLGGAIACYPIYLNVATPGRPLNRFVAAFAQVGFSILLIHLSGGRIETHFHIFGSLAFLAFYRDARVVALATALTAANHLIQGAFWPESIYGVLSSSLWRACEHSAWVAFEDIFLLASIRVGLQELAAIAAQQSELRTALTGTERQIRERTADLMRSQDTVYAQKAALVGSSRLLALGETSASLAHEINAPLSIIQAMAGQISDLLRNEAVDREAVSICASDIERTSERLSKIVRGLSRFSRDDSNDPMEFVPAQKLLDDAIGLCEARFRDHKTKLSFEGFERAPEIECHPSQILQVLLNLLNNAHNAVSKLPERWVRVSYEAVDGWHEIAVEDSGSGVSPLAAEKLSPPAYSEGGHGSGLGFSASKDIVSAHGGEFYLDSGRGQTRFVMRLPRHRKAADPAAA